MLVKHFLNSPLQALGGSIGQPGTVFGVELGVPPTVLLDEVVLLDEDRLVSVLLAVPDPDVPLQEDRLA